MRHGIVPAIVLALAVTGCSGRPVTLGVRDGKLSPCPSSPNCVSSQAEPTDKVHYVEPLVYTDELADAMDRLVAVLESMSRIEVVTREERYLYAEATSLIFRFVDDVEFYFPEGESVVHSRSASRVGYGDMGVNRRRIETIRKRFTQD